MNKRFIQSGVSLFSLLFVLSRPAFAKEVLTFHGNLDFTQHNFTLFLSAGKEDILKAQAEQLRVHDFHVKLNFEHLKTPLFDLSSEVESFIAVLSAENSILPKIRAKVWSNYSILNYKPVRELSGYFEYENNRLLFQDVSFGNIKCDGYAEFVAPFKVDLTFALNEITMEDFLAFWIGQNLYEAAGDISGEIRLTGNAGHPVLKGNLLSNDGLIKQLKYRSMKLNIEGVYPQMQIAQSFMSQDNGLSFSFSGPIDLSDKENFKKQIKALTFIPLVENSSDKVEWTIRRFKDNADSSTEIKYLKMKNQNDSRFSFENRDMLGIERSVDF